MVHPLVLGGGKRLFEEGDGRHALELVDSKTFGTGVLYLTYQPPQSRSTSVESVRRIDELPVSRERS
jgi:hypothetical protein